MKCPECDGKAYVIETEPRQEVLAYRRRGCRACGHRFSTFEISVDEYRELQERIQMTDEPDTATIDRAFMVFVHSFPLDTHEVSFTTKCIACTSTITCGHTMLKARSEQHGNYLLCNECGLILLQQYRIQVGLMQRSFNAWKE